MTETNRRPRRSAWKGRTLGFITVLLLLAGTFYVARQSGTITVAERNESAQGTAATSNPTSDPATRPAAPAATTGSSPTE